MGAKSRWWIPLRFLELHADPGFRRLDDGSRWRVVESLCDCWFIGSIDMRSEGVSDEVWAVVTRLWPGYAEDMRSAEEATERRRKAAERRWAASAKQSTCNADALQMQSNAKTKTKTKTKTKIKTGRRTRTPSGVLGRRAPSGFTPDHTHEAIAAERGIDLNAELARFADHEFATAKSDWPATFRNWLRRAQPTALSRPGTRPHTTDVRLHAFLAEAL